MLYPERFSNLPAHAWPRLRALLDVNEGGGPVIHMTIGEPKHKFPQWVTDVITEHAAGFNNYPPNDAIPFQNRFSSFIVLWPVCASKAKQTQCYIVS